VSEDGGISCTGRCGYARSRPDLGLMPGGIAATLAGHRCGEKTSMGLSEGIGRYAAGAKILLRLSVEFRPRSGF